MKLSARPRRAVCTAVVAALAGTMAITALSRTSALADTVTANQAWRIVQQYTGVWTSPPTNLTSGETVDAPLLGNGDIGVAIGGSIADQTMYIGKNDFFSSTSHAIKPLGRIVITDPAMSGSSYHVVQNIAEEEVDGTYTLGSQTLTTASWVDANWGMYVTSFTLTGGSAQTIGITLQNGSGGTPTISTTGNDLDADVYADTGNSTDPHARIAARTIGQSQSFSGNTINLTIQPGGTSTLVAGIVSSIDSSSWQSSADSIVGNLAQTDVNNHQSSSRSWWQGYWEQSYVEIPDKAIEKSWYGSLYLLGCVSRTGKTAPGLWGNWITQTSMNWNGDYHTNYNYEAPFYAALSTNHIADMDSYDQAVLAYESAGEALASSNGYTGVLYPVGIVPDGIADDTNLHNQKSDAANLASDMVMRFEYTGDTTYAAEVYPWLKEVGLFWQNYLSWNSSTNSYDILNDAPHEDQAYPQTNSGMSLGLVHLLFQGLIDMSTALNQDASTRATWQNIETHLSPLSTMTYNGQTILRETEVGSDFVNDGNDIDAQAIYPGGLVGLDSNSTLISEAQNTIGALTNAWDGGNAPATFYAAAADVGYNPSTILSNLHDEATNESYNNMAIHHNGGGIENLNVTTSGLDEMLLQSFQKDIKVFPDWPSGTNAKFGDLLAYGDFLISSTEAGNSAQYIQAVSQNGGNFTFTNPWSGSVEVYRNGTDTGTVSGSKITIATSIGDTLDLAPAGTALATIQAELAQPLSAAGTSPTPEAPYGGTAAAVPGTVQAANYDTGGQGVAYNIASVNGSADSYRSDGVDLEACTDTGAAGCGYDLGWTGGGQWFKYTVNVASAGTYTVTLRLAAPSAVTDALHIASSSGTNLSGNINIPATGAFQTWTNVTATVTLPAGQQTLTLDEDNGGWNIRYLTFASNGTTTPPPGEAPYGGTAAAIPGTVQAANYDTGGQGVAYNVTSVNGTGNSYRSDGVDLEACTDTGASGCGDDLGWTGTGQWFKYTVNVATAGTYTVTFRMSAPSAVTDALHIANASGTNLSGNVNIAATGAFQTWANVTATVTLPAGQQTLTLDEDNGGWNIRYMAFASSGTTTTGINTSAWYEVVNANSGLCASAAGAATANGTAVQQLACTGATSQLWQFVPTSVSGEYEVLNDNAQSEGESWNITGGVSATASGTLLQIWSYGGTGNTNALFAAQQQSNGDYTFVADNSGLCIDTPGSSTASGAQLQQYTCNGTTAQEFNLVQS